MQDRRRFLLHRQALALHLGRQLRQRGLHAVVDVDGVDVGIGAEREADGQVVAAVIAAGRLHVEHLVDADDLRLERLGDTALPRRRPRRRDRSAETCTCGGTMSGNCATGMRSQRERAGDRDDDRDDDRQPRPVDEDGGDHGCACSRAAGDGWRLRSTPRRRQPLAAGLPAPADTASPGRTRCKPSTITSLAFAAARWSPPRCDGVDCPSWMRRLLRLVLRIDDVDIIALLIGQHGGARNRQHLDRLHALRAAR